MPETKATIIPWNPSDSFLEDQVISKQLNCMFSKQLNIYLDYPHKQKKKKTIYKKDYPNVFILTYQSTRSNVNKQKYSSKKKKIERSCFGSLNDTT